MNKTTKDVLARITKDQLLKPKLKTETLEVEDFGTVILLELTATQVEEVGAKRRANPDESNGQSGARLLAMSIVDETGQRMISDDEAPRLLNLGMGVMQTLVKAVNRLNKLDGADAVKN